jgi:hypothetical protein
MRHKREEAREIRPARAELGALVDHLRELRRGRLQANAGDPAGDISALGRIEILERRIEHLESMLEGLQDAVDRHAVLQGEQISELRRRTGPAQMARALSEDARNRGI